MEVHGPEEGETGPNWARHCGKPCCFVLEVGSNPPYPGEKRLGSQKLRLSTPVDGISIGPVANDSRTKVLVRTRVESDAAWRKMRREWGA